MKTPHIVIAVALTLTCSLSSFAETKKAEPEPAADPATEAARAADTASAAAAGAAVPQDAPAPESPGPAADPATEAARAADTASASAAAGAAAASAAEDAALDRQHHSGVPQWVYLIQSGRTAELIPSSGGYVGVGRAPGREGAVAAAAVDFAGSVATVVTSSVTERSTWDGQSGSDDVLIESQVRSQAVITGMRPRVYEDGDGTWFALYRIDADAYRLRLSTWLDTVAVMNEATRQEELDRLRDERARLEREAEAQRAADLQAQMEREDERRRLSAAQEFLDRSVPAVVMGIDTAALAPARRNLFLQASARDERDIVGRAALGRTWLEVIHVALYADAAWDGTEVSAGEVGLHGRIRLVNNAGALNRFSLAVGGRVGLVPGDVSWDPVDQPERIVDLAEDLRRAAYLSAHVKTPEASHTTWFLYGGTDRVAGGVYWAPLWNAIRDAITLSAAVAVDTGHSTRRTVTGRAGVGFRPTEMVGLSVYADGADRLAVELAIDR